MVNFDFLQRNIPEFEKLIGYSFKDKGNLFKALTHSSYANERKDEKSECNERLEFLGDSVLNIVISESIYIKFPKLTEGELTKIRANIVCEPTLMKCANNVHIGDYLLLGKGEELTGGRSRTSILSDAFEALIGAIYLDGGITSAKQFIKRHMKQYIENSADSTQMLDFKTQLQERVQKESDKKIVYEIIDEKGPDHNKKFVSQVRIGDKVMGRGDGKSKKEADQNAAREALEKI